MIRIPPISLEEAQARLLALSNPLPIERVDMEGALGRFLAAPLNARRTQPAANLSAMDGYAVCPGDMLGPWRVSGESSAGHPYIGEMVGSQAVRISTGAMLPVSAGSVILQEDTERDGDHLHLTGTLPVPEDKHIRRKGFDFEQGAEVLARGTHIGPAQIALAVASGHRHLPVRRRPRVAVIDSGDELASDPENCALHEIPASNGIMIASMISALPCDVVRSKPVPDDVNSLIDALEGYSDMDLIVTSGGASVGDHDLVRPALESWGAEIDFWRVAIKPGKPLLVAMRRSAGRNQIVVGLPGNPVSSHVTAFLFVLPLLRAMLGATLPFPMSATARLASPLKAQGERREFLRAVWNGTEVVPQSVQDSAALVSLAASNALIDRPANAPEAHIGDIVPIFLL